jgi:hypothetical protein
VKVSARGGNKKVVEKEFEHLHAGGYFHHAWDKEKLPHGLYLEVKTHVSGFGKGKEDLPFTLGVPVLYRPDLAVQSLQYPTMVRPNEVVTFQVVVAEGMRDVGAHTDLQLLVDGNQVDVAPQIWVDANSSVTCWLTYKFTSSGKHTVTVRAANVTPRDFDPSNNEMSGDILVSDPAVIFYTASVVDFVDTQDSISDTYLSPSSTTPDQHAKTTQTMQIQNRMFSGWIPSAVKLPLARLVYSDSSDGSALSSLTYTNVAAADAANSCASGDPAFPVMNTISLFDDASNGSLTVRVYSNPETGAGRTTVDMLFSYADATYVSAGYCSSLADSAGRCTAGDFLLTQPPSTVGTKLAIGSTYSANVVVDDGTAYSAQPSMQLTATHSVTPLTDLGCYSENFPAEFPKTCSQFADDNTWRQGGDSRQQ